ncbi:MAG: PKD domain-containing protein [Chitinophagales bacterium]
MKKLLLLACIANIVFTNAQITLDAADMPTIGWNHKVGKDTIISAQNWGNSGANQTYTFTNFQTMLYDTIMYKALTTGQQTTFPGADVAATTDDLNFIFTKTFATNYNWIGIQGILGSCNVNAVYSQQPVFYQFPTQFGGNFSNNSGFQQQIAGSCIGQAVDAIRATNTVTTKDTIDGWGKVTTPVGSYKCLRQKRIDYSTTLIEFRLLSFSPWSSLSTVRDTNVRYYYLTKEAKGSVITFDFDSIDQPIKATWSTVPPALCIADFGATVNGGTVSFHDSTDGYPDTYSWNFGDGSPTSSAQNPTHTYAASGAYYVCLTVTNPSGSNMFCDSVYITNFGPIANDDTATLNQPGTITISPLTGITDLDGDSVCITSIFGNTTNAVIDLFDCNAIEYGYNNNSFTGLDTFYYVVCERKVQPLCDTGMVVINVVACAWPTVSVSHKCLYIGPIYQSCGWATKFTATHSSIDSLSWHLTNIYPETRVLDTILHNIDSFGVKNYRLGAYPDYISVNNISVRACCTFYSSCGVQTVCDSVNIWIEGINEINPSAVKLYPNPASGKLNVDLSALSSEDRTDITAIILYDALGQKVQSVSYQQQPVMNTDIAGLPSGIYTVCVSGASNARKTIGRIQVIH